MNVEVPERLNMADYFLRHNLEEGREHMTCLYFEDQFGSLYWNLRIRRTRKSILELPSA